METVLSFTLELFALVVASVYAWDCVRQYWLLSVKKTRIVIPVRSRRSSPVGNFSVGSTIR